MAVLTIRKAAVCVLCGEARLEGEPLLHTRRGHGGWCPAREMRQQGWWRREMVLVLQQSRLHQELRWTLWPATPISA